MAVYTEVGDEDLERFIGEYDLGPVLSCKGIAEGVENTNYLIQTGQGNFILTLYEKRVAEADLPFFLGLMEHLADKAIPCPTPVHGRDGKALRRLCGRPAVIVTFLKGMWPRRIRTRHCTEVGRALAALHVASQDFAMTRRNALSVDSWRPLLEASAQRAGEVQAGLTDRLSEELAFLESHWPKDLPSGVCHADLFPDNVFFVGDSLSGLIDFYFACNDFLAYDLATCLNAWCFERDRSFNITKARAMLSAYRGVRAFSDAELAAMPVLARGSALRFLLTRLYDWLHHPEGAMVRPKDPLEYLTILQFHQGVASPGAYGLD
ncbi:MAG: homoserine kinase [Alphaproteobacteria bacterium]|nr:homoserine kinase [Alphaproteobacteria bacterium]